MIQLRTYVRSLFGCRTQESNRKQTVHIHKYLEISKRDGYLRSELRWLPLVRRTHVLVDKLFGISVVPFLRF